MDKIISKLIEISKHFGVSLDALIMGNDNRIVEELKNTKQIKPQYQNVHDWEFYASNLLIEYRKSIEEGLDIEQYENLFHSVARLPNSGLNDEILKKNQFPFADRAYVDKIDGMPIDDDTNYVVLAQTIIENYGRDFAPFDVSRAWLQYQN